ncbi:MAG TPA: long-chain fatty acid--CoA ligase [Acidimicrobiales bacterium]|jgi:fatty-acyl-CoA synthase
MTLPGLMQPTPLTLHSIFDRMRAIYPDSSVVSVSGSVAGGDRAVVRHTYAELADRVLRLCTVLRDMGLQPGDRVASFGFNSHRHFELYWAVPLLGGVLHTVNIRLFGEQIAHIVNHAADRFVFVDGDLTDQLAEVSGELTTVEGYIRWGDGDGTGLGATGYEELLDSATPMAIAELPDVPEDAACGICYTSGTTGMPKGVLSSHRGIWLHSMATCMTDAIGIGEHDRILPVVPMFHAFGWGLPYSAPFTGASLVLHGSDTSADALGAVIEDEHVTLAAGVPTIWKDLLPLLQAKEIDYSALRTVFVGGSASPRALIESYEDLGIEYLQVWGMTETGPLACASRPRPRHGRLSRHERLDIQEKTGTILTGVEARIVDEDDQPLPWDGASVGELEVRGPWIASGYYENPEFTKERFHDDWLRTGDMAWMEYDGYFKIVDRAKDLVKSGGEWISSVELEGSLLAHPAVRDAAVVGCHSDKWDERPVAAIVLRPGAAAPTLEEVREFLAPTFAKWWLPDAVEVVDEIPKTSVGKLDKKVLRTQLDHIRLP